MASRERIVEFFAFNRILLYFMCREKQQNGSFPMNKRIRYGIIGFGAFAERTIAPAIQASPNSELVAIQKRSLAAAEEKARTLRIPHAFDSADRLASHPEVDAVFIVSAVAAHAHDALAAAAAGKHVITEKPMAMNASEAQTMINACAQAKVKLMVAQMARFSPLILRFKEILRSGTIGRVSFIRTEYVYDARLSKRVWLQDVKTAGGGASFDIGVHCLDTIRFILEDDVVSVKSQVAPLPTDARTEQTALLALKFSRGTAGSIFCSFVSPLRRIILEAIGQEGIVSAENFPLSNIKGEIRTTFGSNGAAAETKTETVDVPNLYEKEVTAFSESILNDSPVPIPGEEGLKNQRILDETVKL